MTTTSEPGGGSRSVNQNAVPLSAKDERWPEYECPDCGWRETDFLWDATDLEEKGPPVCPQSHNHGQVEMVPFWVVRASALDEAETEVRRLRGLYEEAFSLGHTAGFSDAEDARQALDEAREAIASALTSLGTGPMKDGYAYAVLSDALAGVLARNDEEEKNDV